MSLTKILSDPASCYRNLNALLSEAKPVMASWGRVRLVVGNESFPFSEAIEILWKATHVLEATEKKEAQTKIREICWLAENNKGCLARTFQNLFFTPPILREGSFPTAKSPPQEILTHILSYLPQRDLRNSAVVCHIWNRASGDRKIWEQRFLDDFKFHPVQSLGDSPKKIYQKHFTLLHNIEHRLSTQMTIGLNITKRYKRSIGSELIGDHLVFAYENHCFIYNLKREEEKLEIASIPGHALLFPTEGSLPLSNLLYLQVEQDCFLLKGKEYSLISVWDTSGHCFFASMGYQRSELRKEKLFLFTGENAVEIWDFKEKRLLATVDGGQTKDLFYFYLVEGDRVVYFARDKGAPYLVAFDLQQKKTLFTIPCPEVKKICCLKSLSSTLFACYHQDKIIFHEWATGREIKSVRYPSFPRPFFQDDREMIEKLYNAQSTGEFFALKVDPKQVLIGCAKTGDEIATITVPCQIVRKWFFWENALLFWGQNGRDAHSLYYLEAPFTSSSLPVEIFYLQKPQCDLIDIVDNLVVLASYGKYYFYDLGRRQFILKEVTKQPKQLEPYEVKSRFLFKNGRFLQELEIIDAASYFTRDIDLSSSGVLVINDYAAK